MFSNLKHYFAQDAQMPIEDFPGDELPIQEMPVTDTPTTPYLTEQEAEAAGFLAGMGIGLTILTLLITLVLLASSAKIFQKAGEKWWKALVPFYNAYVALKIVGRPGWWLLLFFIPFVNIVVSIVVAHDYSKAFGQGVGTTVLLVLVPFIMYPMLAFSKDYKFVGPAAGENFTPGAGETQSASAPVGPPAAPAAGDFTAPGASTPPPPPSPGATPNTPDYSVDSQVNPSFHQPEIAAAPSNPVPTPQPPQSPQPSAPPQPVQPAPGQSPEENQNEPEAEDNSSQNRPSQPSA